MSGFVVSLEPMTAMDWFIGLLFIRYFLIMSRLVRLLRISSSRGLLLSSVAHEPHLRGGYVTSLTRVQGMGSYDYVTLRLKGSV